MMKKLYRSRRDSKLFGLCGGIAEYFGADSNLIRLLLVAAAFISGGAALIFYIIASMIVPKEPTGHSTVFPPTFF